MTELDIACLKLKKALLNTDAVHRYEQAQMSRKNIWKMFKKEGKHKKKQGGMETMTFMLLFFVAMIYLTLFHNNRRH